MDIRVATAADISPRIVFELNVDADIAKPADACREGNEELASWGISGVKFPFTKGLGT